MRAVTRYVTFDGMEHKDKVSAERHLDKLYSDQLCSLARNLVNLNAEYAATCDFIDTNLGVFTRLAAIKADKEPVDAVYLQD